MSASVGAERLLGSYALTLWYIFKNCTHFHPSFFFFLLRWIVFLKMADENDKGPTSDKVGENMTGTFLFIYF